MAPQDWDILCTLPVEMIRNPAGTINICQIQLNAVLNCYTQAQYARSPLNSSDVEEMNKLSVAQTLWTYVHTVKDGPLGQPD